MADLAVLFLSLLVLVPVGPGAASSLQLRALELIRSSLRDPLLALNDWNFTSSGSGRDGFWCSWSGIRCAGRLNSSEITSLDLAHRSLFGKIPVEIGSLTGLRYLNLSRNGFFGGIPEAIFELKELRVLDLGRNSLSSSFPPEISNLRLLRFFDAYSNNFNGPLPEEFGSLAFLEHLGLGGSYFNGNIPRSYGNLRNLKFLHLAGNLLEGELPKELGRLKELRRMELGYNKFWGRIPVEFSDLIHLQYLDVSNCSLDGDISPELGKLTSLKTLFLFKNRFTGEIPASFGNLKSLQVLDLSENQLSGEIPAELFSLQQLTELSLMKNRLAGEIPLAIERLQNLSILNLWHNSLTGSLPPNLGMNGKLESLDVSSNLFTGHVPPTLCHGNKLFKLILLGNRFEGVLPRSLTRCSTLSRVRIQGNRINGTIPTGFGSLRNLTYLDLSDNSFSGSIPDDLGFAPKLEYLNISFNSFHGGLPRKIWQARNLQILSAASSNVSGEIPDFTGCNSLYKIELQENSLIGHVPSSISHCRDLLSLNLSWNSLTGIIPRQISTLPSVNTVDLSRNSLTGSIPSSFENCSTLQTFNVAYNRLSGSIPSSGSVFPNLHPSSFRGNPGLCGTILPKKCDRESAEDEGSDKHRQPRKTVGAIVWIAVAASCITCVLVVGIRCLYMKCNTSFNNIDEKGQWTLTTFQKMDITVDAVLRCVKSSDRVIGMGSTGTVYKAETAGGELIAVKRLRNKEMVAEVEVLGNVRHRNIVRLLGCCTNGCSTMLLYEYMKNGNLHDLLHGGNKAGAKFYFNWAKRYKVALGVAQGICYLHHDCDPVIVHRDLKPSNILLDDDMEARVADFGLAKLIEYGGSMSAIAGSYGYIAPEYAYTLQVNEKSDIYSYGVVLMEIVSGKRSLHPEFGEGKNIVDWVRSKIKTNDAIIDVLDKNAGAYIPSIKVEMTQVLRIALLCTGRSPMDRPTMRDVVAMLQEAKPKRRLAGGNHGNV